MIQINPYLIQTFVAIEALLIITWGLVKGGIDMRRMVFAGSAVIFAFTLPWVLGHLVPGFGSITTYQLLQKYAEHSEGKWASVYWWSSKVMLVDAGAMTALDIIEMLSTFGLASIPQQYMTVLMIMGWWLDPIDAIIESINHAAQVLVAIFHTIAWLAWFSWAVAPAILGIALALIIPERTRPMGTALLLLTLAIMFFTSLAAYTLGLSKEAQLINSINQTLSTIESDLPANVTVRGYLLLQSNYPYLVSGQLMNEAVICGPRACHPVPQPVSWFMGFTRPGKYSVGLIDQFAYPQINNATILWLEVNTPYQCDLLIWPPGRNITQGPEKVGQCTTQLFNNNETFAEEIIIEGPHFNLITEAINGTTAYTGAWEWVTPPSSYSVISGNNTVVINATINIPPMHCINITTRAGPHRVCYPGTATADLWLWASSISYPSQLNGTNWVCTLSLTNSSRYPVVDLTQELNTIETFMDKLINETEVSKKLIYPNASIPTYKLPNPTPTGYRQMELSINCINWNNYSVVVPLTITIHGVANNPWFGSVPFLISPADAWVINSPIIGDEPLLINWWNTEIRKTLGFYGFDIPQWLGELAIIYGLLDGAAWLFGLPTILSPVYAIMQGVIMELSLVLYLQIRAVSRLMQRAIRKITKSIGSRLQGSYQALSNKHPRLARALSAPGSAVSRARQFLHGYLGAWVAHHRVARQVLDYVTSPAAARAVRIVMHPWHYGWSEVEARLEEKARTYEEAGFGELESAITEPLKACSGELLKFDITIPHLMWWRGVSDDTIKGVCEDIFSRALLFNWKSPIVEDVFSHLYEDFVERALRHKIGEYYTPWWLIEFMIKHMKKRFNVSFSNKLILDPACGSGRFLVAAFREKINEEKEDIEKAYYSVVGLDILPLAVALARAELMIAYYRATGKLPPGTPLIFWGDFLSSEIGLKAELVREFENISKALAIYTKQEIADKLFKLEKYELLKLLASLEYRLASILKRLAYAHGSGQVSTVINELRREVEMTKPINSIDNAVSLIIKRVLNDDILNQILDLIDKYGNEIWAIPIVSNLFVDLLGKVKPDIVLTNPPWILLSQLPESEWGKKVRGIINNLINKYRSSIPGISRTGMSGDISAIFLHVILKILEREGYVGIVMPASQSYWPNTSTYVGRLLTYAVLIDSGANVEGDSIFVGDVFGHGDLASVFIIKVSKK